MNYKSYWYNWIQHPSVYDPERDQFMLLYENHINYSDKFNVSWGEFNTENGVLRPEYIKDIWNGPVLFGLRGFIIEDFSVIPTTFIKKEAHPDFSGAVSLYDYLEILHERWGNPAWKNSEF